MNMDTENKKKKVLWLEDQFDALMDYASHFFDIDCYVEPVNSVSAALAKLVEMKKKGEKYVAFIFDLKVLPGDDPRWRDLDAKKRKDVHGVDSYLGVELLRLLADAKKTRNEFWRKITFDFEKVIVFSVVNDSAVRDELESFGIPPRQIINKSEGDLDTLPKMVQEIQDKK